MSGIQEGTLRNGTLYIGVTSNLRQRINQHHTGIYENSFTKKYHINKLVYLENFNNIELAINREKELKKWNREWKINLIEKNNGCWEDLSKQV